MHLCRVLCWSRPVCMTTSRCVSQASQLCSVLVKTILLDKIEIHQPGISIVFCVSQDQSAWQVQHAAARCLNRVLRQSRPGCLATSLRCITRNASIDNNNNNSTTNTNTNTTTTDNDNNNNNIDCAPHFLPDLSACLRPLLVQRQQHADAMALT